MALAVVLPAAFLVAAFLVAAPGGGLVAPTALADADPDAIATWQAQFARSIGGDIRIRYYSTWSFVCCNRKRVEAPAWPFQRCRAGNQ